MPSAPIAWIVHEDQPLPPSDQALGRQSQAPGLLAAGGELSLTRLAGAYAQGVFPWYSAGQPVLWWAPDPRMVLATDDFQLSRSLRKTLARFRRTPGCAVRVDSAFEQVIAACAAMPREGQAGTWILPEMVAAYTAWHRAGAVHSFETWMDGELVGGLYGVCLGRMFFGESMFSRRTDASKIALAALVAFCRLHGIVFIDCQQSTRHLASLGAREVPRARFEAHVTRACRAADVEDWTYHDSHWAALGLPLAGSADNAAAASPSAACRPDLPT